MIIYVDFMHASVEIYTLMHALQRCFGLIHNLHCNVYRKGANVRNYIAAST